MSARRYADREWDDGDYDDASTYTNAYTDDYGSGDQEPGAYDEEDERGLVLRTDESLVGVSNIVTQHGTPILSYTRTMNRFYSSRKQRLSLLRHKCEVCGDRIRFWSFETPNGGHTHDGCYERLAWTWTNLYAHQQQMALEGRLE
ncbi:MAG TPA: hypothetical protein VID73_08515 [Ktedonobacterales bacterium]|jgi:hypothetical protein